MLEKCAALVKRYEEIEYSLSQPEVWNDAELSAKLGKEQRQLQPLAETYQKYQGYLADHEAALALGDKEEAELAQQGLAEAEQELRMLLLPRDPNDEKNVILEIRGGVGGEESALFAADLYRMYSMYAATKGFGIEIANLNETELGGIKEISCIISGDGAYSRFKFESGVHRVQRVPETETQGRVHTSTCTVAVLPEIEEAEFHLNETDLKIDVFRSSGAGGQKVNKTSSAIRVTHLPTGLVVECQDERSQYKNKARAISILSSRLAQAEKEKQDAEVSGERRRQVGTGMRNERIRTYNFPQGRCTDHRIGYTSHQLDSIMNGNIDELIDALITADRAEQLAATNKE